MMGACAKIWFLRKWTGIPDASGIVFSSFYKQRKLVSTGLRASDKQRDESTHQVVEDTVVERPFLGSALPQLVVVGVKTLPVGAELV